MKKIILLVLITTIWSCEEDDKLMPVASLQQAPVVSLLNNVDVTINEENASQELVPLSWTAANYDVAVPITYQVEIGLLGNDFANAVEIGSTSDLSFSISGEDLNMALWEWGVYPGLEAPVEARVVSFVDENLEEGESQPIQLNVTGFAPEEMEQGALYVATQYPDYTWNWMNAQTICSPENNGVYTGFLNVSSDNEHYFLPAGGDLTIYGASNIDNLLEPDGEGIIPAESGYFQVAVNTNTRAYSFAPAQFGIIGSSTPSGWDADTDMTYDAETMMWSITTNMVPGEFKFRANDAWDLNYGVGANPGALAQDGPNIAFDGEGEFTITMSLTGCCFQYAIADSAGEMIQDYGSCEASGSGGGGAEAMNNLYLVGEATAAGWNNNSNNRR